MRSLLIPLPRQHALAAPETESEIRIQSIVILTVSILSILGGGWIILSFACFKSMRSFRHYLILGLAISDCAMALNFLLSSSMNVSGRLIRHPDQAGFCSFNGFMTQVFVVQTDYWVLTIALCTYFILADFRRLSCYVQNQRWLLMALPWVFSIVWASLGLVLAGYGDIGAWCWFTSDKVRLLVNFVPRWVVIGAMLGMYSHLAFILCRAHGRFQFPPEYSSEDPTSSGSRTLYAAMQPGPRSGVMNNTSSNGAGRQRKHQKTNLKLKMLARLMLMYPIVYMLIWILPTAVRIYQSSKGVPAPFALQTVDKACIVLQGFVDAIVYGVNESSLSNWRNLLFPRPFPVTDGISLTHVRKPIPPRFPSSRVSDCEAVIGDPANSLCTTVPETTTKWSEANESSEGLA
ncbi:hypothetical protein SAPIO_CDS6729 [Scedosporium apiospermum]|uniref:G-protein coupled receptors family 2 profile 2 domain-containing protein n=1 Tax=Pseudallescheria apiosperma TaxID=563466 RepID=A0A084G342_PSEDA|nr:uncharacterized protein SAPIO_CDS6729 [Scedosporium apiospermum]KEZ41754.1 hypothetical protein SAPIO_CDS6729 [Scedosporium apiospermum]